MDLTEQEVRFLAHRTRLVNAWRYVGVVLLASLAGVVGWLFWFVPLLANPFSVLTLLKDASIPSSTMALSTAMLPIVFLICILLALAIVLFVFAAVSNERKYLSIVQRMTGPSQASRCAARPSVHAESQVERR
jgi:hypothetical protein